jgi:hypothetical protein
MSNSENLVVTRHLSVIYADDLRQEIDGKITIVGMYQTQMLVPAFPITLPKLAVLMTAVTPAEQPFGKVTLQLLKDSEILQNIEMDLSGQDIPLPKSDAGGIPTMELQFANIISPLQLDGPCKLKARLVTELGTIAGRPLTITAAPSHVLNQAAQ